MNRAAFDIYIEIQLAPTLQPGDVVIAGNLGSHKSAHVQDVLKSQGSWMLFLPPYSPDLNPCMVGSCFARVRPGPVRRLTATLAGLLQTDVGKQHDEKVHEGTIHQVLFSTSIMYDAFKNNICLHHQASRLPHGKASMIIASQKLDIGWKLK